MLNVKNGVIKMDEKIFKEWIGSYPKAMQRGFHRDGIINVDVFSREKTKILFILKEPNSKKGKYDKYFGYDLREVFGKMGLKKRLDYNIARWTKILCDGVDVGQSFPWDDVAQTKQRVAIINLKKMAGSGSENREELCLYSYKDKDFIKRQISGINPDVIVACGADGIVSRMVWRIINDNILFSNDNEAEYSVRLKGKSVPVFVSYHPSLRLKKQEEDAAAAIVAISKRLRQSARCCT